MNLLVNSIMVAIVIFVAFAAGRVYERTTLCKDFDNCIGVTKESVK